jgi:hypothetical protein
LSTVTTPPTLAALLLRLSCALPESASSWLTHTLADEALLCSRPRLRLAFTQLRRKLGAVAETRPADEQTACTLVDLARLALVLAAFERLPASEHAPLLDELYRTGEQREQQSVLRMLPCLPDPARFTSLAVEACRTNSALVFAAIANDNPFAAQHFPALSFNQLVLKAVFVGVPVARIHGLSARVDSELRRMLEDYASERRAAGRVVPPDVARVLAL